MLAVRKVAPAVAAGCTVILNRPAGRRFRRRLPNVWMKPNCRTECPVGPAVRPRTSARNFWSIRFAAKSLHRLAAVGKQLIEAPPGM